MQLYKTLGRHTVHLFIYDFNHLTPVTPISIALYPRSTASKILLMIGPLPLPLDRPLHIHNIPQLASQLHNPTAYHARINRYRLLDKFLGGGRGVEAHDEVVAAVMAGLIFLHGAAEEEGAPVRYAADYTALGENEGTGCAGNPGVKDVSLCRGKLAAAYRRVTELS